MLFCLCTKFLYSEEPEYDAGKSGKMIIWRLAFSKFCPKAHRQTCDQ